MTDWFRDYPDATCIIMKNDEVIYTSDYKGVRPLLEFYREFGASRGDIKVTDRIMGKGAIVLALLCQAVEVMTPIISEAAFELASQHGLKVHYDKKVPYIINRQGDGRCPIEESVLAIDDLQVAYLRIVETIKELMRNK